MKNVKEKILFSRTTMHKLWYFYDIVKYLNRSNWDGLKFTCNLKIMGK